MYNFLKSLVKWPLVVGLASYGGYKSHNRIEKIADKIHYSGLNAEKGYASKKTSLKLTICRDKNEEGNLETYLCGNGTKIPILKRNLGLICGDADYNFKNFKPEEVEKLCPKPNCREEDENDDKKSVIGGLLEGLYEFIFD